MIQWIINIYVSHTPTVVVVGYIVPFAVNAFEFTLRTIKEYREDLQSRAKAAADKQNYSDEIAKWEAGPKNPSQKPPWAAWSYIPTLKVGHILARLLGIVTPVINFFVTLMNMDRVFDWIGKGFKWFGKLFDIPLVPKR